MPGDRGVDDWELHDLCNRGIDRLVEEELGPTSSLDHGSPPLHHDGGVDDHVDELQHLSLHTTGNDLEEPARPAYQGHPITSVKNCVWETYGRKDNGDVPLRLEGNVDELDGLQLRKIQSFTAV